MSGERYGLARDHSPDIGWGPSYLTNLIANGERETPLANFHIAPTLLLYPYLIF